MPKKTACRRKNGIESIVTIFEPLPQKSWTILCFGLLSPLPSIKLVPKGLELGDGVCQGEMYCTKG